MMWIDWKGVKVAGAYLSHLPRRLQKGMPREMIELQHRVLKPKEALLL